MNLLRRLLGNSDGEWGSRRAPHVTRSDDFQPPPEIAQEAPSDDAPAVEAAAPETPAVDSAPPMPPASETKIEAPTPVQTVKLAPAPSGASVDADPPARKSHGLRYGIASDVGKQRKNNEDACFALGWRAMTSDEAPDFGLFVVADGMGGHLDGEKASSIAARALAAEMLASASMSLLRRNADDNIMESLLNAAQKANLEVIQEVPGGGTTLTAAVVVGNLVYLAHVGDSRAYLITDERVEQLTTDHTLVQRLIEMKELTPQEAEHYPQKNVLYRAIGQDETLKVERLIRSLPAASQLLICSDGLWDLVDDETLGKALRSASTPQEACDQLIALANRRGGSDNISLIVIAAAE